MYRSSLKYIYPYICIYNTYITYIFIFTINKHLICFPSAFVEEIDYQFDMSALNLL